MKFIANVGKLKEKLSPVFTIATSGGDKDYEHLDKITMSVNGDSVSALAFNGHMCINISVSDLDDPGLEFECSEEGSVTVDATDFKNTLDAFSPSTNGIFSVEEKQEFYLTNSTDNEEYQGVAVYSEPVESPNFASKFEKNVEIDRNVFLNGISKIEYAIGYRPTKPFTFHWLLDVDEKTARFVAGDNNRFAVWDISGETVLNADRRQRFCVHKEYTPIIKSIAKNHVGQNEIDDRLVIKRASADNNIPAQMVFCFKGFDVTVVGIRQEIEDEWPDVNIALNRESDFVVFTRAGDWEYPVKGLWATFTEEVQKQFEGHQTLLTFDPNEEYVYAESQTGSTARRKIPVVDYKKKSEEASQTKFDTLYVRQVYNKIDDKDDTLSFEYSEGKPLIVKYPVKENNTLNIQEQFTTFFANSR